jgi:hypothetical protein
MSDSFVITEKNCTTGEEITRPMTAEEIEQHQADVASMQARMAAEDEAKAALEALKASAKAKLIAGEPLTAEEAATIVF